ncbi:MAG: ribonuclease P protein component [Acholeplasmatales bacterium]|jgi:ribonuclease P protein component|nr:ribonuclease P protein component [Acholeplasmatales bacterium]
MKREFSLASKKVIDSIFALREAKTTKNFTIIKKVNQGPHFRFLISIGRKYGNSVKRNLMKRRIRAIIDLNSLVIGLFDFVIIVKTFANELKYEEIKKEIEGLLKKSHIINGE